MFSVLLSVDAWASPVSDGGRGLKHERVIQLRSSLQRRPSVMAGVD